VKIDDVKLDAGSDIPAHEGEPLGGETVALASLRALVPFCALVLDPVILRDSV
jgi:hypothetical protein